MISFSVKRKRSQGERVKLLVMSSFHQFSHFRKYHYLVLNNENPDISAWSDRFRPIKTLNTPLRHHLSKPQKYLYCQHQYHKKVFSILSLILKPHMSTSFLKSHHMPVRISRVLFTGNFFAWYANLQTQGLQFAGISNSHFHSISRGLFLTCQLFSGNKGERGVTLGIISYLGSDVLFCYM